MRAKITKTLLTDDNHEFKIGSDVCFNLNRNDNTYRCFGVIKDIHDNSFDINKVQIDGMNVSDELTIKYEEVEKGILKYTDNSYY